MQLAIIDGTTIYPLDGYIHLGNDGMGLPPVSVIEHSGPLQDGALYLATRLQPRLIRLVLLFSAVDAVDYWNRRSELLRLFAPGRQLTLRATLPTGDVRDIDVVYAGGLSLSSSDKRGSTHKIVVELRASDPLWRSQFSSLVSFGDSLIQHPFTIPIMVPISIGTAQLDETIDVQYNGTWPASPIVRIYGPITNPQVINITTGKKLALSLTLTAGEHIVIDTRYGYTSVIDHTGQSRLSSLSPDSDLAYFTLVPAPIAPAGWNVLRAVGDYATAQADITVEYWERFIGI